MTQPPNCPTCGAPLAVSPDGGLAAVCPACGEPWAKGIGAKENAAADKEPVVVILDGAPLIIEPAAVELAVVEAKVAEEPIVIDEPAVEAQLATDIVAQLATEPEPVFLSVGPVEEVPAQARKLPDGPWFLETPEGLRFGPVSREELAQWVAEGRVSLDCRLKRSPDLDLAPGDFFPGLKVPPRRSHPLPGMRAVPPHRPAGPIPAPQFAAPQPPPEKKPAAAAPTAANPGELTWRASHRGYWVLLLAICSWAACPLLGVVAWLMATHDLQEMQAGRMDAAGEPETSLALWLGMSHVIVSAAILVIGLVAGALAVAMR